MNIFEKIMNLRIKIHGAGLTKSGRNKFSNFDYYELKDIIPTITQLCNDEKVALQSSFTHEEARLTAINIEDPQEQFIVTLPIPELKKMDRMNYVQSAGAYITYYRRNLYVTMFEITENDEISSEELDTEPAKGQNENIDKHEYNYSKVNGTKGKFNKARGQIKKAENEDKKKTKNGKRTNVITGKVTSKKSEDFQTADKVEENNIDMLASNHLHTISKRLEVKKLEYNKFNILKEARLISKEPDSELNQDLFNRIKKEIKREGIK